MSVVPTVTAPVGTQSNPFLIPCDGSFSIPHAGNFTLQTDEYATGVYAEIYPKDSTNPPDDNVCENSTNYDLSPVNTSGNNWTFSFSALMGDVNQEQTAKEYRIKTYIVYDGPGGTQCDASTHDFWLKCEN